ncbi:MAG: nitroreductase family protein [Nitrospiraceae bacterium]|nr:MAG: nitroreductase family protein [Nitrospiraceae bacterium]
MLEIIRKRRSIRSYFEKEIEEDKITEILKAAMFSPTARALRPWEFIIVKDSANKKRLSQATPYASFAKNAPIIIIIAYDTDKGNRFKEDCSIAAGHVYLEAVNQDLGTCYIQISDGAEGSKGDPEAYVKEILDIPDHIRVHCLMPLGYPSKHHEPHKDTEFQESKIHYEKY